MKTSLIVTLIAIVGLTLLGYFPYDNLNVKARRRQEAIDRDFPNVISKIALLVTAGMNIVKLLRKRLRAVILLCIRKYREW